MIRVKDVKILNNVCKFMQPFEFEIYFDTEIEIKQNELEWGIVFVASENEEQKLLSHRSQPFQRGKHKIYLQSGVIEPARIPEESIIGSSLVLLVAYYKDELSFQVGYFVEHELEDDTAELKFDNIQRRILDTPHVLDLSSDDLHTAFENVSSARLSDLVIEIDMKEEEEEEN